MTRGVECAHTGDTLQQAAWKMKGLNVGSLPVCAEDERVVGIITDRDMTVRATAEGMDPNTAHVREAMTSDVQYCFEDSDVEEASRLMREKQIRRVLVLNRDKRLAGIVSLGDLAVETHNRNLAGKTVEAVSQHSEPE
jgi:CBS domain-containing protein